MHPFGKSRLVSEWMEKGAAVKMKAELWEREGFWTELHEQGG